MQHLRKPAVAVPSTPRKRQSCRVMSRRCWVQLHAAQLTSSDTQGTDRAARGLHLFRCNGGARLRPFGEGASHHQARRIVGAGTPRSRARLGTGQCNRIYHALEHSLEVQLPFLQAVLYDFKLLPLAVGDATPLEVAEVLDVLWGGPETLLVVSSDLSHFLPYARARVVDGATVQDILSLAPGITHEQACGATPINGLLLAAGLRHLKPHLLGNCNSGDTAGDRARVVGYAAFEFLESDHASP